MQNNKVINYLTYLCVLLCVGCRQLSNTTPASIVITSTVEGTDSVPSYQEIFDSIQFIPLETNKKSLIGDIRQLIVSHNRLFVSDYESIKCFSINGNYLFDVGGKGRGPGEYTQAANICCDSSYIYIFDQLKLYQYDVYTGRFIKNIRLSEPNAYSVVKDNYIYCYGMANGIKISCYAIEDTDKSQLLYAPQKGETIIPVEFPLIQSGSRLFYCDPLRGIIYELSDGKMNKYLYYDMKDKFIPEKELLSGAKYTLFDNKMSFFGRSYIADDIITFDYYINNEQRRCLVNLNTMKHRDFGIFEPKQSHMIESPWTIMYSDDTYIYDLINPEYLYEEKFINIPDKYASFEKLRKAKPDDNRIVRRIKLKYNLLNE